MNVSKRQIAISWAKKTLKSDNILFLDTETTGTDGNAKIVDLGVIDKNGNVVINLLLNPNMPMPVEATNVNGITDSMLKGCPMFVNVATTVRKLLTGKTIIAWNSAFDKRMVENEFKNIGERIPVCTWVDEMPMYGNYANKAQRSKLCIAAKECGIIEEQSHRAVDDCLFTLEVLKHMT